MKLLEKVRMKLLGAALGGGLGLLGCSSQPPVPDWQMTAHDSAQRAVVALLQGNPRLEKLEFDRARAATARTGDPALLARIELLRCAAQVASLDIEPCAAFEALRLDAAAAEKAYADYLLGRVEATQLVWLPAAQQRVATSANPAAALQAVSDPLSRLVAAAVLLQTGRADPAVMALATDTASVQGWSRPLLAWLLVQMRRAEAAGEPSEAARLQRRIAIVESAGTAP
ncbi:hypothetical protein [Simplicispira psychrophila]|uniref:hypothetical protein n=1 Tax=Simplicispira psychrophila TaxID=80882 RepID=UPI001FDEB1A3|nr:hypothetical protein [Simplicispira psychrophila]